MYAQEPISHSELTLYFSVMMKASSNNRILFYKICSIEQYTKALTKDIRLVKVVMKRLQ